MTNAADIAAPSCEPKAPTTLQTRLAAEVREGLKRTRQTQAALSRRTGINEPHVSMLLNGIRVGSLGAWDALLRAAHTPPPPRPECVQPEVAENNRGWQRW